MLIHMTESRIKLPSDLAMHFCADDVDAGDLHREYQRIQRILLNPEKFPRADFDGLERVSELMFNLSPIACMTGPTIKA